MNDIFIPGTQSVVETKITSRLHLNTTPIFGASPEQWWVKAHCEVPRMPCKRQGVDPSRSNTFGILRNRRPGGQPAPPEQCSLCQGFVNKSLFGLGRSLLPAWRRLNPIEQGHFIGEGRPYVIEGGVGNRDVTVHAVRMESGQDLFVLFAFQ